MTSRCALVEIVRGYEPGALGRIVEMHALYYTAQAGFGRFFECKVAGELAEFAARLDDPEQGLWLAVQEGRVVGAVALDVKAGKRKTAHLRWFIVGDGARGRGAGRRLLEAALAHADAAGVELTYLWTFQGLDAARHLYESTGFRLIQEVRASQWGVEVLEQRFERKRG